MDTKDRTLFRKKKVEKIERLRVKSFWFSFDSIYSVFSEITCSDRIQQFGFHIAVAFYRLKDR